MCTIAEQITQHYVAIYTNVLLILEPKEHKFAHVRQCLPLETLEVRPLHSLCESNLFVKQVQTDKENTVVNLISNNRTHTLIFKDEKYCLEFTKNLEAARRELRDDRLRQVLSLLDCKLGEIKLRPDSGF